MPLTHLARAKTAPHFVLVGNFGVGNFGDELILAGCLAELRQRFPAARFTVLTPKAAAVRRWHGKLATTPLLPTGVRSLLRSDWLRTLRVLRTADAVIYPGGGLWTDGESRQAVVTWSVHLLIARALWLPVYLLGQSVGPIRCPLMRKLAGFALRRATLIETRDAASLIALQQLGVPSELARLGRDSALALALAQPYKPHKHYKNPPKKLKLLVSVRDFPHLPAELWSALAETLEQLSRAGVAIDFAEFGAGDTAVWRRLCRQIPSAKQFGSVKLVPPLGSSLRTLGSYHAVLGMRLHSLIAAHLVGVPSIALAYSPKVEAWQTEHGGISLTLTGLTSQKLWQTWQQIEKRVKSNTAKH
jgi:polysaccharide pyruvyl transferase CsaB